MIRLARPVIFAMTCGIATMALAAGETPQPVQQHNTNAVWFENWGSLKNAALTVRLPDGEIQRVETERGTPVFQLTGREIQDGIYRYELSAATDETRKVVNQLDNGRGEAARSEAAVPFYTSGQFVVQRGVIVTPEDLKEE